jgi:hypothetical protein
MSFWDGIHDALPYGVLVITVALAIEVRRLRILTGILLLRTNKL